jgi:DsbE subfamily thiol:disulfide oxidoreductase
VNPTASRRALWTAIVVLPVLMLGVALVALRSHAERPSAPDTATIADFLAKPVREDRPAPSFSLSSLAGRGDVTLSSFRGRVVVLNLWASWCGPCRREAPELQRVWTADRSRGVVVLGIDHEDTKAGGLGFRKRHGLTYPMASDPSGSVAASYTAVGVPATFVIDRAGRIRYRLLGQVSRGVLQPLLDRVLSGRP